MLTRMPEKGTIIHCWWECKLVQTLWKTIWRLLKKLNIDLRYDPAIPLLGIYLKECNSSYYKGTYIPMFIAAVFTTAKLWKQPKCPTTNESIKKMCFYTQLNFTQPQRRMKFCHSQVNGWNWRTSSWVKLAKLRRPKTARSPSYVDYRLKTNAEILLDMGHTLRESRHRRNKKRKGNLKLECG
jgi:hypothetical protein